MLTYKVKKVKSPVVNSVSRTCDLAMTIVRHATARLPSYAYVLVTYLLSYLGTYLFTPLLTRHILQPLLYKLSNTVPQTSDDKFGGARMLGNSKMKLPDAMHAGQQRSLNSREI